MKYCIKLCLVWSFCVKHPSDAPRPHICLVYTVYMQTFPPKTKSLNFFFPSVSSAKYFTVLLICILSANSRGQPLRSFSLVRAHAMSARKCAKDIHWILQIELYSTPAALCYRGRDDLNSSRTRRSITPWKKWDKCSPINWDPDSIHSVRSLHLRSVARWTSTCAPHAYSLLDDELRAFTPTRKPIKVNSIGPGTFAYTISYEIMSLGFDLESTNLYRKVSIFTGFAYKH